MKLSLRRRGGEPLLAGACDLYPGEGILKAAYAWSQVIADSEKASLRFPCNGCGAPAYQLCYSPTGLPASAPCPERLVVARG